MEAHVKRIVTEKEELDVKRRDLKTFTGSEFFQTLPEDKKIALLKQSTIMTEYSQILKYRLSLEGVK